MVLSIGLCECGCGEKTPLYNRSDSRDGSVKGQPKRFVLGHWVRVRGGIKRHYKSFRFIIDDSTGCWHWALAKCNQDKYGYCSTGDGRSNLAHIIYYVDAKGPVPEGLELDHLCRNTDCVNPDHLEAVTRKENNRRKPATKLNVEKVKEIRTRFATGGESQAKLAREFGVHVSTLKSVIQRFTWQDVT